MIYLRIFYSSCLLQMIIAAVIILPSNVNVFAQTTISIDELALFLITRREVFLFPITRREIFCFLSQDVKFFCFLSRKVKFFVSYHAR